MRFMLLILLVRECDFQVYKLCEKAPNQIGQRPITPSSCVVIQPTFIIEQMHF